MERYSIGQTGEASGQTDNGGGWISAQDAARLLGVNERTVRRWADADKIHAVRVRGTRGLEYRFRIADVRAYRMLLPQPDVADLPGDADTRDSEAPGQTVTETGDAAEGGTRTGEPDPLTDAYRELLVRHEQAVYRVGWLEGQMDRMPALEASADELRERARQAEDCRAQAFFERERLALRCRAWGVSALVLAVLLLIAGVGLVRLASRPPTAAAPGGPAQVEEALRSARTRDAPARTAPAPRAAMPGKRSPVSRPTGKPLRPAGAAAVPPRPGGP
jgi:excisionase family DNA binding protein